MWHLYKKKKKKDTYAPVTQLRKVIIIKASEDYWVSIVADLLLHLF